MEAARNPRSLATAAARVAIFTIPGVARAGSLDLSSSMSGFCIGADSLS
jgi:hypothetical protein